MLEVIVFILLTLGALGAMAKSISEGKLGETLVCLAIVALSLIGVFQTDVKTETFVPVQVSYSISEDTLVLKADKAIKTYFSIADMNMITKHLEDYQVTIENDYNIFGELNSSNIKLIKRVKSASK